MKKVYKKPEIVFESFSMSTNIAGDCERIVHNPAKDTCGIPGSVPGFNIFSNSVTGTDGCQVWDESDMHDGFCYHVPTEYNNLFNS